jgi:hypothetical protein
MNREWLVPLVILFANACAVFVSILAPYLLGPAQYADFSLIWSSGQFMTGLLFEWLRLAALRYSAPGVAGAAGRKQTLVRCYVSLSSALLLLIAVTWPILPSSYWKVGAGAVFFAVCQGSFDGGQAFVRAARANLVFTRNWALRAVLSVAAVGLIAKLVGNGWWTVIGLGASLAVSLGLGLVIDRRGRSADDRPPAETGWPELSRLARYGMLAAVAGIVANALPTIVRWGLVDQLGKVGAAGALLAVDLSQKALSVTGLAVNVVAMQNSFSAVDGGVEEEIRRSNQRQIAWAVAAVVPVGLIVYLLGNEISQVLMRDAYRAAFLAGLGACVLASGLVCVRLFAVDPLFYAFEKAGLSMVGAIVSLVLCGIGFTLPGKLGWGAIGPLTIFSGSAAVGLLVSVSLAVRVLRVPLPWPDLARIALAAGAVVLVDEIVPHPDAKIGLVLIGGLLGITYAVVAILLDTVGLRGEVTRRLKR